VHADEGEEDDGNYRDGAAVGNYHAPTEVELVVRMTLLDLDPRIRNCAIVEAAHDRVQEKEDEELIVVRADAIVDKQTVLPRQHPTLHVRGDGACAVRTTGAYTQPRESVSYVIHPLDTALAHFTVVRAVWPPMRTLLAKVSLPRRPLATASVPRNEPRVF